MASKDKTNIYMAGQEHVQRALEVGAVGNSSILLVGPHGAEKAMLTTIYSKLIGNEAMKLSISDSIEDIKQKEKNCDPNTLIVAENLTGFTRTVLSYIKEMAIHKRPVIASMYPCLCGYMGNRYKSCFCTPSQQQMYKIKTISVVEMFDIYVEVQVLTSKDIMVMVTGNYKGEAIEAVKTRIKKAQDAGYTSFKVHQTAASILETAIQRFGFSMKTVGKIIRIARSIANLADSERIGTEHISEAIQYRIMGCI